MRLVSSVGVWIGLVVCGCGEEPAAPPNQAAFDAFVAARNRCAASEDCAFAGSGCAALCGVSVNDSFVEEVNAEANRLNAEYANQNGVGLACHALCAEEYPVCIAGRCRKQAGAP